MSLLLRFLRLPGRCRLDLLEATAALAAARVALWTLPFRAARRGSQSALLAGDRVGAASTERETEVCRRVAWAVASAGRFVPAATCLVRALAVQRMLRRRGLESAVRIGVKRAEGREFRAHAWVECAGRVVVGAERGLDGYVALPI